MVCGHRLGEPEPSGLPGRCPRRVPGRASGCAWRPRDRGAVRLVDCPHRRHARGNWRGHRNDAGPRGRSLVGTRFLRLCDQSQAARSVPRPLHRGRRQEPALAKAGDDRRDAHVLADSLRTDRHAFRRLSNDEPVIVKLREWSRMADDLQQERSRLASRMREQLWRYYPQMLELADDLAADWFLDLWSQAPTPAKAGRLRETTIERFVKAHRLRRWQAPEVLRILRQKPLSVAPGVIEAASDHIRTLTVRIRLVNQQLKAAHRKLDELCAQLIPSEQNEPGQRCEQRDVVILRSMPGLGRIILAVLLAEVWQPLRRRDYHALRSLSGVAPVTRRSGKTSVVVRRYACNKRLANALYHWARLATQRDALSRRRYAALRQRGHSHGRALRTIADPLLSVACTLLEQQTLFDPEYEVRDAAGA